MKTQKQNEPQLSALTEENAKKYLIMKINLTQLKDETQTRLKETILSDYWLELKKSQELETIATKSAKNTTREIIDAYKKNTGIDDDLFIQFLEVMYDYHKEQQ